VRKGLLVFWRYILPLVLVGVIAYQLTTVWVPLWLRGAELEGMDVSAMTLEDESGRMVALSEFNGSPVVLNFWATWCLPCRVEIPELAAVYPELVEEGKVLVGVNVQESWPDIEKFRGEVAMPFPVMRDNGMLSSALGITLIPAMVIVDENGRIEKMIYGFRPWVRWYLKWFI